MVKHRRYSDKPRTPPPVDVPDKFYTEPTQDFSATFPKTNKDFKSILLSGTKYAYIIGAVALLSGIFTPLTLGVEIEDVIFGMLSILLGLGGGIVSKVITFTGTFGFFTMISLSLTQSDPSNSQVFLYAFYHAGILGGAMYQMNRLTANLNKWEDYMNGS